MLNAKDAAEMTYQAILFDLDDTLVSLRGCEAEALRRTLRATNLLPRLPADFTLVADSYARISAAYWAARAGDGFRRYAREQVIELSWRDFLGHYDLDLRRAARLAEQYWTEFCRSRALMPGALDTLEHLSQHFRLGLITNGYSDSQRRRLQATGLIRYFDPILISEEAGAAKPDAAIFEMALEALALRRDEIIYIGDSIGHDFRGCRNAGINFCHYCPKPGDGDLPDVKYRIARLEDLIQILLPGATP